MKAPQRFAYHVLGVCVSSTTSGREVRGNYPLLYVNKYPSRIAPHDKALSFAFSEASSLFACRFHRVSDGSSVAAHPKGTGQKDIGFLQLPGSVSGCLRANQHETNQTNSATKPSCSVPHCTRVQFLPSCCDWLRSWSIVKYRDSCSHSFWYLHINSPQSSKLRRLRPLCGLRYTQVVFDPDLLVKHCLQ